MTHSDQSVAQLASPPRAQPSVGPLAAEPSVGPLAKPPTTMLAAVHERYGAPEEVVTVRTVPVPDVGPGDVLVRVGAASVNALDWHYVTGLPMFARPTLGLRRPKRRVPGADVAGVVEVVGPRRDQPEPWRPRLRGGVGRRVRAVRRGAGPLAGAGPRRGVDGGRRDPRGGGGDGATGSARLGRVAARPARARQRRLGRGRQLRRPARQDAGRLACDSRVQLRQRRGRAQRRSRPRRRLHLRGRPRPRRHLRPLLRQRRHPGPARLPPSPDAGRHLCHGHLAQVQVAASAAADAQRAGLLRLRGAECPGVQGRLTQPDRPRAPRRAGRVRPADAGDGPSVGARRCRRGAAGAGRVPRPRQVGGHPRSSRESRTRHNGSCSPRDGTPRLQGEEAVSLRRTARTACSSRTRNRR